MKPQKMSDCHKLDLQKREFLVWAKTPVSLVTITNNIFLNYYGTIIERKVAFMDAAVQVFNTVIKSLWTDQDHSGKVIWMQNGPLLFPLKIIEGDINHQFPHSRAFIQRPHVFSTDRKVITLL